MKKGMVREILLICVAMLGLVAPVGASILHYDFELVVDEKIGDNPYSLEIGSVIDVLIDLDTDQGESDGTKSQHNASNDTEFFLSMNFGGTVYEFTDDMWYEPSHEFPIVTILESDLSINVIDFMIKIDSDYIGIGMQSTQRSFDDPHTFGEGEDETGDQWSFSGALPEGVKPIPEPSTMLLCGMGLLGLTRLTRKKECC